MQVTHFKVEKLAGLLLGTHTPFPTRFNYYSFVAGLLQKGSLLLLKCLKSAVEFQNIFIYNVNLSNSVFYIMSAMATLHGRIHVLLLCWCYHKGIILYIS